MIVGALYVTVLVAVRVFPAPSRATTVMVFEPGTRLSGLLQFAVAVPDAVPPAAAVPFTVTLVTPLPPALSVAVPLTVIFAVVTVELFAGLDTESVGAVVSGAL